MPVRLLVRPAFIEAVTERLDWLAENRTEDHLDNFLAALTSVRDGIRRNPQRGPIVRQDAHHVLRMCLFPRPLPYLVYYAHRKAHPITEVQLVRLFGSGQRRPKIRMAQWPW